MRQRTCQIRPGVSDAAGLVLLGLRLAFFALCETRAANPLEPGLAVSFTMVDSGGSKTSDVAVLPNVQLYVAARSSPTPFLPVGRFTADWVGYISSEIRDNYTFQAELNGELKLEINGAVMWEAGAKGTNTGPGKPVRLNKGTNAFRVHFTSPGEGDAWVQLIWSTKEFAPEPIARNALTHATTPELQHANQLRLGRQLFIEFRCAKCHQGPAPNAGIPELAMDAPALDGIGSRRNYEWMARWIADPRALRPTAHMPKLFHGPKAKEDAEAVASFLASQKSETEEMKEPPAGQAQAGKKDFETLHCIACHNTPGTAENDPQKISLLHVREKFTAGALVAFLRKPGEHYAWIRMPDFKLTAYEAAQLAAFIQSGAEASKSHTAPTPTDKTVIERGGKLAQSSGCLNCHSLKIESTFKTAPLAALTSDQWKQGCLTEKPGDDSQAPQFHFSTAERGALQAFAATDRASLTRHVPIEFAERQSRLLRCAECHGKFEGFPPFEGLGGKLKPDWIKDFIQGAVAYKPRAWIEARMPAFTKYAEGLATGLAAEHGLPPETPAEPPVDAEAAKIGRRLVSAAGGFFCVSCHAVGSVAAMQVFESQGVNLAYTGARAQKSYFHRWVRNPLRIDPATKMPVYFDAEGKSPLTEYYNGDAEKQIESIWQYLRLGDKMPPPVEPH
jgi:cbb3-type cytochrome oxidase cytochrome c subunit